VSKFVHLNLYTSLNQFIHSMRRDLAAFSDVQAGKFRQAYKVFKTTVSDPSDLSLV